MIFFNIYSNIFYIVTLFKLIQLEKSVTRKVFIVCIVLFTIRNDKHCERRPVSSTSIALKCKKGRYLISIMHQEMTEWIFWVRALKSCGYFIMCCVDKIFVMPVSHVGKHKKEYQYLVVTTFLQTLPDDFKLKLVFQKTALCCSVLQILDKSIRKKTQFLLDEISVRWIQRKTLKIFVSMELLFQVY